MLGFLCKKDKLYNYNSILIKTIIDTWYKNNLTAYTSKLADETFCNDRSIISSSGYLLTSTTIYAAYNRITLDKNLKPAILITKGDGSVLSPFIVK